MYLKYFLNISVKWYKGGKERDTFREINIKILHKMKETEIFIFFKY